MSALDRELMRNALAVAHRGLGQTAPNPAVGALIANEATGEIIARGWTQPGGRPHAETEAIRRAGPRARGATLYVTLEPCAHFGKTPPCADAIVRAGLARVVIGAGDPDPRTAGQGAAKLRAAGLAVTEGVEEAQARWLTLGHILRVTQHRPFVTIKIAADAHGEIPEGDSRAPRFVTSPEARAAGHLMRARSDAIIVGAGTVRADDPSLDCRLPGLAHRSPLRVVLQGKSALPEHARLWDSVRGGPVLIVAPGEGPGHDGLGTRAGLEVQRLASISDQPAIAATLELLAARGITRMLVEGGPRIWRAFADAGLFDEVVLFIAGRNASDEFAATVLDRSLGPVNVLLTQTRATGPDTLRHYRHQPDQPGGAL